MTTGASDALGRPQLTSVVTQWSVEPLAIALVVVLGASYVWGVRRLAAQGRTWSRGRCAVFGVGLLLLLWTASGAPQAYAHALYWAWLSQTLALWLFVPIIVLTGHPVQLARAVSGRRGRVERAMRSAPIRAIANPLVGPALVPILSFALFFGPVPGWAIGVPGADSVLHLLLLVIGAAMVLPLVGLDEDASSLAVGFSLVIGSFELVIDAVPGIVLRLNTHLVSSYFDHRTTYGWTPRPLRDQQLGGGILWTVAELIDLPFLYLVFRRWLRADARDAAHVDAVLEAERAMRRGLTEDHGDRDPDLPDRPGAERDVPWWVSDPAMQQRLRQQR